MAIQLTPKRRNQIAWELLRYRFKHEETTLNPVKIRRSIGNLSNMIGVSKEELEALIRVLLEEILEESFRKESKRKE